jgi:hypothetical protein
VITGSSAFADDDSKIFRALAVSRFKFQTARLRSASARQANAARAGLARFAPRQASSPVFFAAPGRPSSSPPSRGQVFFPRQKAEGMEHRAAHQSSVLPHPLLKDAGASRRSIAAISDPRVRVSRSTSPVSFGFHAAGSTPRRASAIGRPGRPCPASSSRSGRSTARSVPEASRCCGYEPQQQAPHQPVSGFPPPVHQGRCRISGTVPSRGSIFETSREDALSRARRCGPWRVILAKL